MMFCRVNAAITFFTVSTHILSAKQHKMWVDGIVQGQARLHLVLKLVIFELPPQFIVCTSDLRLSCVWWNRAVDFSDVLASRSAVTCCNQLQPRAKD